MFEFLAALIGLIGTGLILGQNAGDKARDEENMRTQYSWSKEDAVNAGYSPLVIAENSPSWAPIGGAYANANTSMMSQLTSTLGQIGLGVGTESRREGFTEKENAKQREAQFILEGMKENASMKELKESLTAQKEMNWQDNKTKENIAKFNADVQKEIADKNRALGYEELKLKREVTVHDFQMAEKEYNLQMAKHKWDKKMDTVDRATWIIDKALSYCVADANTRLNALSNALPF